MKLLGMVLTSDLRWTKNTENLCRKGYERMWMLRRLKGLGANQLDLKEVYEKQIRSVLEYGTPVYTAGLRSEDISNIERVQKTAMHIILGSGYNSYNDACENLDLETLKDRRLNICKEFANKNLKHPKFSSWFKKSEEWSSLNERKCKKLPDQPLLKPVECRTRRFRKSPLPFLTNLINNT